MANGFPLGSLANVASAPVRIQEAQDAPDPQKLDKVAQKDAVSFAVRAEPNGPLTRLVIEKDSETGVFIQRQYDRESGDLIFQWPREEWLRIVTRLNQVADRLLDERV